MRELSVDLFSTVDGFGGGGPQPAAYWGYDGPGLAEWIEAKQAEEHITIMGATTYRLMAEIVANGDDPSFSRMTELPKIVFSKRLKSPLSWANTSVIDEPIERALPGLKAQADGLPMRTMGSYSLVRSLFQHNLVDRVRVMYFPTIHGVAGEEPLFARLPHVKLSLTDVTVIDKRLVLHDYSVGEH